MSATILLAVSITAEQMAEGWGDNVDEFAASVAAALFEVQADNGDAIRPDVYHVAPDEPFSGWQDAKHIGGPTQ